MILTIRNWLMASLPALVTAILLASLMTSAADAASDGRRMALVIGNGDYLQRPLKNPVSDARDVAAALRTVDFEVLDGYNLSHDAMADIIALFLQKSETADAVLFYYAGHGFQLNSTNYIVPSDSSFTNAAALKAKIFDVQKIVSSMSRQNHTTLVFLDACRDNPLDPPAAGEGISRSTAGSAIEGGAEGFAEMTAAPGTFISFSTEPRKVALDGVGRNSPFAQALVKHIGEPNRSISDLMIAVRKDVQQITGGRQTPWDQSSLTSQFYFRQLASIDQPVAPMVSDQSGGLFGIGGDGGFVMDSQTVDTRATETGLGSSGQTVAPAPDANGGQAGKTAARPAKDKAIQKKPDKRSVPQAQTTQRKRKPSSLPPDVAVGVGIGGL